MAFHTLDFQHLVKFNSATSSKFIDMYESFIDEQILEESARPHSETFAPSSVRCKRQSWFRLRGVQPEIPTVPDRNLLFIADIGTACHRIIQERLSNKLGSDWIDVEDHLKSINPSYSYEITKEGYESLIEIHDPPIKFAVDGVIQINGKKYLLEIKSSEHHAWDELTDPKPHHIDQIRCYSALLNISDVLMLYIDRQYGDIKCFEVNVTWDEQQNVLSMFDEVQQCVASNIAPDRLPRGDRWCTPSMCRYYNKCKEWG